MRHNKEAVLMAFICEIPDQNVKKVLGSMLNYPNSWRWAFHFNVRSVNRQFNCDI